MSKEDNPHYDELAEGPPPPTTVERLLAVLPLACFFASVIVLLQRYGQTGVLNEDRVANRLYLTLGEYPAICVPLVFAGVYVYFSWIWFVRARLYFAMVSALALAGLIYWLAINLKTGPAG